MRAERPRGFDPRSGEMRWLAVCAFLGLMTSCQASVNLWVSKAETRALIGLATEIFYVQEGVINEYAMNFTVIVPRNISDLHFNWKRTTRKPVSYDISLEVADPSVLDRPTLNIPSSGTVPQDHQLFTVHLPCQPGVTAETDVRLKISLLLPRQPPLRRKKTNTVLTFRRTRVCRSEVTPTVAPRSGDEVMLDDPPGPTRLGDPPPEDESSSSGVLYMAIGSSCGVVLVIMIILAVVLSRNSAAKRRKRALSDTSGEYDTTHHYMQVPTPSYSCHSIRSSHHYASLRPLPTCPSYTSQKTVTTPLGPSIGQTHSLGSHGGTATFGQPLSHSVSQGLSHSSGSSGQPSSGQGSGHGSGQRVRDVGERVSELMVDRRRVELETVLEEGNFGRIATGWMADSDRGEKERLIIKYVSERASPAQVSLLLQEGLVFYGLRHKNLLSVLGVAVEERAPPLVLYPYVKHWNLKQYLQTCSFGSRSDVRTLTVRDVVDLAEQVTQALLYLHVQNICHTDVAARNCCIDDSLHVKLADNALSRDLFPDDYCCLADNINRSIKWMAMEAILTNQYTPAADVWSFGVLLWELTTLAQQPYVEVDPFEMASFLDEGYRLAQPLNCPDKLFSVMAFCWSREPEERPTAEQILDYLHSFTKQLSHYL